MVPKCADDYNHDQKNLNFVKKLNHPKSKLQKHLVTDDDIHCTFMPKKDPKALKAMKHSKLGYDFLDREDRNNFLERVGYTNERTMSKKEKFLEADYEARLDKLICPKCKKEQSYDEYKSKVRECRMCKKRFGPAVVVNQEKFEKKLKENESKRLERLAKAEEEIYGHKAFKAKPAPKVTPPNRSISPLDLKKTSAISRMPQPQSKVDFNWSTKPDLGKMKGSNALPIARLTSNGQRNENAVSSGAGRHNVRSGDENIEPKRDISNVCKENEPDFNDGSSFELNISVDHMPAEPPRVVKELDYKLPVDDDSAVNKNSRTSKTMDNRKKPPSPRKLQK